jgi:hypothetical protein
MDGTGRQTRSPQQEHSSQRAATNEAPEEDVPGKETGSAPPPLNRQQRRALAARTRATPQFTPSSLHQETG